jgi:peptidoglycan lytic transglycosylase
MAWRLGMRLALVVGALLSLSACATHRVATAPARPAPPPTIPAPPSTPAVGYEETGEASWYGNPYHGRRAASGEIYDMNQMTAAHRTLPFGARIRVQSLVDGSSVEVRVNDRGPFKDSEKRILDLSYAAARLLGAIGPGVIPIRLRVVSMPSPPTATAPPPATAPSATVPSPPPAAPAAPVAAAASPSPPPAAAAASSEPAASPPAQAAPPLAAEKREPRVTMVSSAEAAAQAPSPSLPAATASPPPSASRTVEGWSLQLAAYASEAPALSLRDSLARSWPDARVLRAEVGGRPMWRVRVGNYATRREADEAAKRLAASGHRAMVVEAGPP